MTLDVRGGVTVSEEGGTAAQQTVKILMSYMKRNLVENSRSRRN
jgi:hypothetical protein